MHAADRDGLSEQRRRVAFGQASQRLQVEGAVGEEPGEQAQHHNSNDQQAASRGHDDLQFTGDGGFYRCGTSQWMAALLPLPSDPLRACIISALPMDEPQERAPGTTTRDSDGAAACSSVSLLFRAQQGDDSAREELCARYLPRLRRWAHRRLPPWARQHLDTEDLVQDTLLQTVRHLDGFTPNHERAFSAYVSQALGNRVRDAVRAATGGRGRASRRRPHRE